MSAPEGIVFEDPVYPPTTLLRLEAQGLTLAVWSGTVDVQIPVYATSVFTSECRPLDQDAATLEVTVRYQACDDHNCLLPRTEKLCLEVPVEPVDVWSIGIHTDHGQRESAMHSAAHLRRLFLRKVRAQPLACFASCGRTSSSSEPPGVEGARADGALLGARAHLINPDRARGPNSARDEVAEATDASRLRRPSRRGIEGIAALRRDFATQRSRRRGVPGDRAGL